MADYIHGFDEQERRRLLRQGEFLAPLIYSDVDFTKCKSILEVGSGVGAQTLQLLKRFPKAHITCVELSETQLETARRVLRTPIRQGRVTLVQGSAEALPFRSGSFDAAFVCWLLEHVSNPGKVLAQVARVLRKNGTLCAREVFNQLWYAYPASRTLDRHWRTFNTNQLRMGGDPFVGVRLGTLLEKNGFRKIEIEFRTQVVDSRDRVRKREMMAYWRDLFLSGNTASASARKKIRQEFARISADPGGGMFFGFTAAHAARK